MKLIIKLLISTIAVWVAANIVPGVQIADFKTALIFAIILGILNVFVKPILSLIALPITLITLGLFSLVINVLMILLAANIVEGVVVAGFISALLFSIVMTLVSWFLNLIAS
jgi:putative membrane protein